MKVLDIVNKHIVPIIEGEGYEVVETAYVKEYEEMHLVFYVHKKGGVTLEDCERVSILVDPLLDEFDPTDGAPYVLDVSSPGLDRPIKTDKDYARFVGEKIELKLYAAINKQKVFSGELVAKTPTQVILNIEGREQAFELTQIASAKPYISFS